MVEYRCEHGEGEVIASEIRKEEAVIRGGRRNDI